MRLSKDDPFYDSPTFIDTRPFKVYADKIRKVICAHDTPVSIRTIYLLLGGDARPEWTADALEAINGIMAIGVLPTRYQPSNRPVRQPNEYSFNRTRA